MQVLSQSFMARGLDATRANGMALEVMNRLVRRESYIMAYNDWFWFLGILLLSGIVLLWFMEKVTSAPK